MSRETKALRAGLLCFTGCAAAQTLPDLEGQPPHHFKPLRSAALAPARLRWKTLLSQAILLYGGAQRFIHLPPSPFRRAFLREIDVKFGSVCSGIEAASVAWNTLGWKAQWLAEIDPFPCSLLAHNYPNTPNLGDMTKYNDWPTDDQHAIDLLCGGTPCQSFSVAGLRKGLDDPRGNLMLTFGAVAAKYRPKWLVWENVPGVLSSNGGRDFGAFLGMLGQLGYGFAYRVLDAQYFGVAQRRRRVFVVGCLGDWRSAAAVLFERHSLQGHPAPSRKARQGIAGGIEIGPAGGCYSDLSPTLDTRAKDGPIRNQLAGAVMEVMPILDQRAGRSGANSFATSGGLVPVPHAHISPALKARDSKGPSSDGDGDGDGDGAILVPICFDTTQITSAANYSNPKAGDPCHPLAAQAHVPAIAFQERGRAHGPNLEIGGDVAFALTAPNGGGRAQERNVLTPSMQVRRLTPEECEKLQGFPPGYTAVPNRGKPAADGPRYKALGNSWAVPNVQWIGSRIDAVALINKAQAATN